MLTAIDIYNGEKVIHTMLCDIHLQAYQEAGEFPFQICNTENHSMDEVCDQCELEQTVIRCSVCGGETEHNWEVHVAELRNG